MDRLSPVLRGWRNRLYFWCPGCGEQHVVKIGDDGWTYNGVPEAPTFQPSVKVEYPHWEPPAPTTEKQHEVIDVCHFFVTDGHIQFLDDCTHELRGQTVDLPPFPEDH